MIFISVLLSIFIAYEIQKLVQFNLFFRLTCLVADYYKQILEKTTTVVYKEIIKKVLIELLYAIVIFIMLFTYNSYFSASILLLSIITPLAFNIKNKLFRKMFFALDILLSISLLSLSIINIIFFKLNAIDFIKELIELI